MVKCPRSKLFSTCVVFITHYVCRLRHFLGTLIRHANTGATSALCVAVIESPFKARPMVTSNSPKAVPARILFAELPAVQVTPIAGAVNDKTFATTGTYDDDANQSASSKDAKNWTHTPCLRILEIYL